MESPSNGKGVQKICIFSWNFYIKIKEKISLWPDGNQGVSKGASAASNCVSLEFYYAIHCALAKCPAPQHAKSFHHVFTVCSMCSDIPKDSERSTCKLTWLITVSILRLCGLPEHDNRALVVLLETLPHCQSATATTFCFYSMFIRTQNHHCFVHHKECWMAFFGPYYNRWRCHSIVAPL